MYSFTLIKKNIHIKKIHNIFIKKDKYKHNLLNKKKNEKKDKNKWDY